MKEWTVKKQTNAYSFLTDRVTLFKGEIDEWKNEIDDIKNYFYNNTNNIYEGNKKIVTQDYELSILSYSDFIEAKGYKNSKKKVEELFLSYLELSPFYKQLIDSWEDLQEEVSFLTNEMNVPLSIELNNFSKNIVKNNLQVQEKIETSIDIILNEIRLIKSFIRNKNHIFLIIAPENLLTSNEISKLDHFISKQKDQFLICSNSNFTATTNIKHREQILNELTLTHLKNEIQDLLPFPWVDNSFNKSIPLFIELVDNSNNETVNLALDVVDNLEMFIYIFIFLYLIKIPFRIDTKGIPDQYKIYIESVLTGTV